MANSQGGWSLTDDGEDVCIQGPGRLDIVLRRFEPQRLQHQEGLPPEMIGTLRQLSWRYPVELPDDFSKECVWLELIATWDSTGGGVPLHILHLGTNVTWELPQEFSEALQRFFARKEEGIHG